MISFNKPHLTGKELVYMAEALKKQTSCNGQFTKKCHDFFQEKYDFKKVLLTSSCTDALEMAALLLDITPGDEIIMPSFTYVSTANPFVLRGAKIIFVDSLPENPNMDVSKIKNYISEKTKAIVVVHYAGVAVDMDPLMTLARQHNLFVIEDAAQAIDAYYKGKALGSIGHLGCFSFHETKNIISGEGGMIVINDERFFERAEIIWEKGTNRNAFIQGKVDKYGWVDVGSSFSPSEIIAAFLYAQAEDITNIQQLRMNVWNYYYQNFSSIASSHEIGTPQIPDFSTHNGHIYYLVTNDKQQRDYLIKFFMTHGIDAHFHYSPLHLSEFYKLKTNQEGLSNALNFSERIIRLPLYADLQKHEQDYIMRTLEHALSEMISIPNQNPAIY